MNNRESKKERKKGEGQELKRNNRYKGKSSSALIDWEICKLMMQLCAHLGAISNT